MPAVKKKPVGVKKVTVGVSPKTRLAAILPSVSTLATVLISWLVSGELGQSELKAALIGLVASALATLGAYLGDPGVVVNKNAT